MLFGKAYATDVEAGDLFSVEVELLFFTMRIDNQRDCVGLSVGMQWKCFNQKSGREGFDYLPCGVCSDFDGVVFICCRYEVDDSCIGGQFSRIYIKWFACYRAIVGFYHFKMKFTRFI